MDSPSYSDLLDLIQQLRQLLAERDRTIEQLQKTNQELHKRLEAAERAVKRQAAPFSKRKPKANPQKPGRKKGEEHGTHAHRPPPDTPINEFYDATLPPACPDCGGTVIETHQDQQFQTEIPQRPITRQFTIHCGHCQNCGKSCRGRHPLQTSDAVGAAESQLGPHAQATVAYLNKHAGMSYGKIAHTFKNCFGISVSRGTCARVVLRAGKRLQPAYEEIKGKIKTSEHITPDETGWRKEGRPAWLHAVVGDDGATCFVIDPHRGADVLAEVIGFEWSGTMTHDGYAAYDRFVYAVHQQCLDHGLRRARTLEEKQKGAAKKFPRQVIALFEGALETRDEYRAGRIDQTAMEQAHDLYVDQLFDLTETPRQNEQNEKFARHLYHHGERWFEFLLNPSIPATNHRAEQALKTPIVNRKVWGGNRTDAGAEAQEIISSVLETCKRKAIEVVGYISNALCGRVGKLFGQEEEG